MGDGTSTRWLLGTAATGCLLSLASHVHGATIAYNTTTPIPSTATDWAGSLSFPRFDTTLGTLTGVELKLTAGLQTTITVSNNSATPSAGSARSEILLWAQDGSGNLIDPVIDLLSPAFGFNLGAGQQVISGMLTKNSSSDDLYDAGSPNWATIQSEFSGTSSIMLNCSTFTQTLTSFSGGSTEGNSVANTSLTGSVTYIYTPVPEPALLGLLAIPTLAGLMRRRRGDR